MNPFSDSRSTDSKRSQPDAPPDPGKTRTAKLREHLLLAFLLVGLVLSLGKLQRHTVQAQSRKTNHLAGSTSPYLLEHAHNPVDWYPWGDEALQKARLENKPIFLSVGYSACHWCHVMEREDFEDPEIARILNQNFVCIKVDREERPDIDAQYMLAVQILTQQGGWPMSVWLTPDLKPFYSGTYYPPDDFKPLLEKIAATWKDRPDAAKQIADQVVLRMRQATEAATRKTTAALPADIEQKATASLLQEIDAVHGGFGTKPKFPEAPRLVFLLEQYRQTRRPEILAALTKTLDGMALGGLTDQLGGGFHRYSTDAQWLIPHFEKMLTDQAQLAPIYLDAFALTHKPLYRQVAVEALDFVLREMTDADAGGFYSTLDADSAGKEGSFYVWTAAQIEQALGKPDAARFEQSYGVSENGNFESGSSVLHLSAPLTEAQEKALSPLRAALLEARSRRTRPATDDKVVAGWNGLMIAAFARGFEATGDARYRAAAVRAAEFLTHTLTLPDGTMLRTARGGKAGGVTGFLDDYAFAVDGLLTLGEATKDPRWAAEARRIADRMSARFWDKDGAGGFLSPGPNGAPVAGMHDGEDNATPSPNGIAAQDLVRLAAMPAADRPATEPALRRKQAAQTVQAFQPLLTRAPSAFPSLLIAWHAVRSADASRP